MSANPGGATQEVGAAMDSVQGPRPISVPDTLPRASAAVGSLVAGPQAVPPVQRGEAGNNQQQSTSSGPDFSDVLARLESKLPENVNLDIVYDDSIKREVVRGTSRVTGETILEFPTEEMRKLIRGLREELGLTVDQEI